MTTEQDLRRAEQVRRWLDDALFLQVFDDIRLEQFLAIENSEPSDVDAREHFYDMLKVIEAFKARLEAIASAAPHERAREAAQTMMK